MITTVIAFVLSVATAAVVYFVAQYSMIAAGIAAGGITTVVTVVYLLRVISKLKRALMLAVLAHDESKHAQLLILERVRRKLDGAKTNRHRVTLVEGLTKYIQHFKGELKNGDVVLQLADDSE